MLAAARVVDGALVRTFFLVVLQQCAQSGRLLLHELRLVHLEKLLVDHLRRNAGNVHVRASCGTELDWTRRAGLRAFAGQVLRTLSSFSSVLLCR